MKNNRETKNKKGMAPAVLLVLMVLVSTCAFAQKGELLYKGWYNSGSSVLNGMTTTDFMSPYVIEIYEKEIHNVTNGDTYYINGPMKYSMFTSQGVCADVFVDNNYNLTLHKYHPVGTEIKKYTRADSSPVNTSQGGYYGGGGNNGGYNNGGGGNQGGGGSTPQPKQHQCGLCKGSGRTIKTDGTSFGNTKWCSECGKTVPDYHYHSPCESCKGKGWW